jgi:hypothetical protein
MTVIQWYSKQEVQDGQAMKATRDGCYDFKIKSSILIGCIRGPEPDLT